MRQILETPDTMRILNPYRYGSSLDAYILSLNPTLWIAARKETAYANGNPMPIATDHSGFANHPTQGTAAYQPTFAATGIGGRPALLFDGVDDSMDCPTPISWIDEVTALVVCQNTEASGSGGLLLALSSHISNRRFYVPYFATTDFVYFGYYDSAIKMTIGSYNTDSHVYAVDGVSEAWVDGVSKGTTPGQHVAANNDLQLLGEGTINSFGGYMSEAIVFDRNLTPAQREPLETMLGVEYGITITH